jgi:hypothetical protein
VVERTVNDGMVSLDAMMEVIASQVAAHEATFQIQLDTTTMQHRGYGTEYEASFLPKGRETPIRGYGESVSIALQYLIRRMGNEL